MAPRTTLTFWARGLAVLLCSVIPAVACLLLPLNSPRWHLALQCFGAVASGVLVGGYGYDAYMRQYFWMGTGRQFTGLTSLVPAAAVADASVLEFWNPKTETTTGLVDGTRVIGFSDQNLYCVAPILSKKQANASVIRVEFWAVGVDCCTRRGSFVCDDAGEAGA